MDFIEWSIRTAQNIQRHGLNLQTVLITFLTLYNVRVIRKIVEKRIPKRYRHTDQLDRIEQNQRVIMEHLGVVECVEKRDLSLNLGSHSLKSLRGEKYFARIADVFIRKESTTYLRRMKMKEYLKKLGRTKFQALLVSLVINVASAVLFMTGTLDIDGRINEFMPIINMTIGTISTWVYIIVEGGIDKASAQKTEVITPLTDPKESESHFR